MKTFEQVFDDSTEMALYNIVIVSENDQIQEFDGVSDYYAREVFEKLKEQAGPGELDDE